MIWRILAISAILFLISTNFVFADTYIPLDNPVYFYLKKLEAEGLIESSMLSTLPISRMEGTRLTSEALENAEKSDSPYLRTLIAKLREEFKSDLDSERSVFLKPLDAVSVEYAYSAHLSFFRQKNRDGVVVKEGNNGLLSLTSRFDSKYLGLSVTPELRAYDDETFVKLKKGYALLNLGREEFLFGNESAWWGPGGNGALLLSNNAEPVNMVKISNSMPYDIFGVGFRGTFFISRLEEDRRDVQSPILYGVRLDLKPCRFLEMGLAKTAIFGGKGRNENFGTFLRSLTGAGENPDTTDINEPGDQRAGYDVKLVLPFKYQPLVLYTEGAGEDQGGVFPSKWAYIYGVYLPRVANLERLELWGEYANTWVPSSPGVWYSHHIYTQGYTFKGRIIGHYIGNNAKDLFLKGRYNFDTAALSVSYERLEKETPRFVREDYGISFSKELFKRGVVELYGYYSREETSNLFLHLILSYRL